jgi:hypothetical protein
VVHFAAGYTIVAPGAESVATGIYISETPVPVAIFTLAELPPVAVAVGVLVYEGV